MSPLLKIVVGALMMVLGVFTSIRFSTQLVELVLGGVGPLLVLIGAFIVWLESDELKVQREESQKKKQQEFERQQTLDQQESGGESSREPREAAQEIKQAVSTGREQDNEEILSGTVREVKEEVSDRDDINVQELLEAERNGKNRKTLVNYLERQVE